MTNIEINKKIVDVRGLKTIEINGEWFFGREESGEPYKDGYWSLTNWAENIADAWELFEEMGEQVITQDRYNGTYSGGK